MFAKARKLWFLPTQVVGQVDVAGIVMRALADAFAFEDGEEGTVDIESLILHLCASTESKETGVKKAMELAKVLAVLKLVPERPKETPEAEGDGEDGGDHSEKENAEEDPEEATKVSPEAPEEPTPEPEVPPTPEAAAARFAAMGPMSDAAITLLTVHDVQGGDVEVLKSQEALMSAIIQLGARQGSLPDDASEPQDRGEAVYGGEEGELVTLLADLDISPDEWLVWKHEMLDDGYTIPEIETMQTELMAVRGMVSELYGKQMRLNARVKTLLKHARRSWMQPCACCRRSRRGSRSGFSCTRSTCRTR